MAPSPHMTDLLRNVSVVDGPLSEQLNRAPEEAVERGDNVVLICFEGDRAEDVVLHLRRGMTRIEVAEALEVAASIIHPGPS